MSQENIDRPLYGDKTFATPEDFIAKAKAAVEVAEYVGDIPREASFITTDALYIVWFAKTLGNWKALISTDLVDGIYWEVTYNGAKQESYVDRYEKIRNTVVPD